MHKRRSCLLQAGRSQTIALDQFPLQICHNFPKVSSLVALNISYTYLIAYLDLGTTHLTGLPIHVYPLYENGFRAFRGQSIEQNNKESANLYAEFARVAENNPAAWNYGQKAATEESIRTVTKRNRMICLPYPLLMNAFNNINLAGTVLLTSTEYARELGVPQSQWIYPLGGAGTSDPFNCMYQLTQSASTLD